jgi:uncharacterized protein YjbI with pentapeptide repeats
LIGANLCGANLIGANLTDAKFCESDVSLADHLAGGFDMLDEHGKKIQMKCTDLSGANLIGHNLDDLKSRGAIISKILGLED